MKKILALLLLVTSISLTAQDQLYKVSLLRAKPGSLLELIDVLKKDMQLYENNQNAKPYLLRHSQGDQWDLMLIFPIPPLSEYFSMNQSANALNRNWLEKPYGDPFYDMISFQEEAIVKGTEADAFAKSLEEYDLFHIEIFTSLVGKQKELLDQRKAENVFYAELDHRPNFIFTRIFGPSWDNFTIGGYTDMHDFAGPDVPFEKEDAAAKKAGFEGVNFIGSYLRELLSGHHDTLAWKVK